MAGYELRVHGIGSHQALSSLGEAVLVAGQQRLGLYEAPPAPAHRVRMLSWTPAARSTFSPLWWFALPATLINVAGHMRPTTRSVYSIVHAGVVGVMSLLVTIGYLLWGVALAELVLSRVAGLRGESWVSAVVAVLVTLAIVATILVRASRHISGRAPKVWAIVHAIAVAGLGGWLVIARPATIFAPGTSFTICTSTGSGCGPYPNALAAYVAASAEVAVALAAVCVILDLIGYRFSRDPAVRGTGQPGLVGTAALIVVAVLALNTVGSLINIALAWFMAYLDRMLPLIDQVTGLQSTQHHSDMVLTPWEPPILMRFLDIVPLFAVAAFIGLMVVVWASRPRARSGSPRRDIVERYAKAARPDPVDPRFVTAVAKAETLHRFVRDLRANLPVALAAAGVCGIILAGLLVWLLRHAYGVGLSLLIMVDHALALGVAMGAIVLVLFPGARSLIGFLGDVAGYWPIVWSPLTGMPYAPTVVQELNKEICDRNGQPLVVVGHSQGSVISFDTIRQLNRSSADLSGVSLVTCGSPLATLYSTFFPAYYPQEAFTAVSGCVTWVNVWRSTDPIASPMPEAAGNMEIEVLDDPKAPKLRRHSGYWTHKEQAAQVRRMLRPRSEPPGIKVQAP